MIYTNIFFQYDIVILEKLAHDKNQLYSDCFHARSESWNPDHSSGPRMNQINRFALLIQTSQQIQFWLNFKNSRLTLSCILAEKSRKQYESQLKKSSVIRTNFFSPYHLLIFFASFCNVTIDYVQKAKCKSHLKRFLQPYRPHTSSITSKKLPYISKTKPLVLRSLRHM